MANKNSVQVPGVSSDGPKASTPLEVGEPSTGHQADPSQVSSLKEEAYIQLRDGFGKAIIEFTNSLPLEERVFLTFRLLIDTLAAWIAAFGEEDLTLDEVSEWLTLRVRQARGIPNAG